MSTFDVHDLTARPSKDSEFETVRNVIDAAADTRAEDIFLVSPHKGLTLTFGGLQQAARKLGVELQKLGLGRGDKVAFLIDNGLFTAQLFLGLMYGGFVAVPLNVGAGESQLSFTLDHSDAKIVYVNHDYTPLLRTVMANVSRKIHVIFADVDGGPESFDEESDSIDLAVPQPEDPALLMYTSGSTGQPKAAVHSQRTILAHGRNSICSHQLTASDRSLLALPLYHINAECVTLVPTLMSGGAVVIPHRFKVSQFWDWLDEYACTWSALVPTIVSQLLDWKDPRAGQREAAFSRIRFLRSSSAPLAPSLHREFLEKFKLLLIQAMGSSEAGNVFSNPLAPRANKIGSPGLPWGFETKIIDRQGSELSAGEPGEVLLRGEGLAQGYYKDPEATAAAFDHDGWFHTGDLAYCDEEGYFFVVGRSKELIIKGGVNIAPRQIDDVLESHPAVLEAAAVGVPDHYLGEDVVAFVVLRTGLSCDERELLSFCESRLGLFKTPTRIHFVSDLPKGPSGKVQRLRLREDAAQLSTGNAAASATEFEKVGENEFTPASAALSVSATEEIIAEVWQEVLSQPKLDRDSNFFELGGHSLLAVKCVSLLRERIATPLSLSDFFENATIAQQAALIKRRLDSGPENGAAPESTPFPDSALAFQNVSSSVSPAAIPPRDRKLSCPLTSAQRRVWFFEELDPGQPLYNEAEAVRLIGELNVDVLEHAVNVVVERHEVLRSTIETQGNEPVVVVHDSWPLRIKRIDLSDLPAVRRQTEVDRLLVDEPREPYHLESRPGIRVTLIRLAPKEHVLILMMHHIICDWSSEGVLWRELSALYSSLLRGETPALPPLPIQHGDYAVWQLQHDTEPAFSKDLAFWEETLRSAQQLLDLPADRVRPPALSYRGKRQRFVLNAELTQALRKLSQGAQTTLFTVFAAAFNTLLYRYTGQSDILLGIPIADRDRTELQSMMGFLLHTQVLRTQISDDITFRELLSRVQRAALDLYLHRAVPFDQVVRRLQPERNPAYATLFQVMLNWRDRDQLLSFIGLEGLTVESLIADARTAKFDLTLFATDCGDNIWLEAEYNTDLFDDDRIARMFGHYQTLLQSVAADVETRVSELPLLTDGEKEQLQNWNGTAADYPRDNCLHRLFEEQVERTPEEIAVEFSDQRLTYRELDERANQLAHYLRRCGVAADVLVGIYMERSVEMVVSLYAVLKAGGAYVPIDPEYPRERVEFMLRDTDAPVLLTQERLKDSLPKSSAKLVSVDGDWELIAKEEVSKPAAEIAPRNLAYMIYTSGSTGRPKGAMNTHGGICNRLLWMQDRYGLKRSDKVVQKTPFSFDVSVWEFFWPLISGARLVVAEPGGHRDPTYLVKLITEQGVTVAHFVPSMLALFLEQPNVAECRTLLHVICSGEALPYEVQERFFERLSSELHNLYGPTEAAVDVTHWTCRRHDERKIVPIGRPVANTQIYILDRELQPAPIGVAGELYLGGVQVGRGYHKRPELTTERFIPDPFSSDPEARLYKTGDLGRWLPDGAVEYLGRTDFQVKIRGLRIELGEIESVLRNHPGVREAVITVREGRGKELVAYVVAAEGAECTTSELRDYLKEKLPEYMVPAAWVQLETLPLSPNGKLDRKALPAPESALSSNESEYMPPEDDFERLICEAWAEVLGLTRVGVRDNFFDLGGHSLLAVQLLLRLQEIIPGEPLPLRAVLEAPTVEQFAVWLRSHRDDEYKTLVRMRTGSAERAPFFCVHGAGGSVLSIRSLATALPADLPFYGFQDPALEGTAPFDTIEEKAQCFVDELLRVQPRGPYYIGGKCYGGAVSLEMARILTKIGKRVALVVLIDSFNHSFALSLSKMERLFRNLRYFCRRVGFHVKRLRSERPDDVLGYVRRRFWALLTHLRNFNAPRPILPDFGLPRNSRLGDRLRRIMEANVRALGNFRPRPYSGDVLIFKPSVRRLYDDYYLGWRSVVHGKIDCFEIEGDHSTIFEQPRVQEIADSLHKKLMALSSTQESVVQDVSSGSESFAPSSAVVGESGA
ncbi:MAG: amino acid adenylation domain-containing protein [Candidatus Acidiferrales bacterium]